jgi:hypothetical protein
VSTDRPFADLSDAELEAARRDKEAEIERLRTRKLPYRDDCHRGIDAAGEGARRFIAETLSENIWDLSRPVMIPLIPAGIGDAWALANVPEIAAEWHKAVDASGIAFAPGLRRAIAGIEREQRLRDLDRERALLDAKAAALDTQAAAP